MVIPVINSKGESNIFCSISYVTIDRIQKTVGYRKFVAKTWIFNFVYVPPKEEIIKHSMGSHLCYSHSFIIKISLIHQFRIWPVSVVWYDNVTNKISLLKSKNWNKKKYYEGSILFDTLCAIHPYNVNI